MALDVIIVSIFMIIFMIWETKRPIGLENEI